MKRRSRAWAAPTPPPACLGAWYVQGMLPYYRLAAECGAASDGGTIFTQKPTDVHRTDDWLCRRQPGVAAPTAAALPKAESGELRARLLQTKCAGLCQVTATKAECWTERIFALPSHTRSVPRPHSLPKNCIFASFRKSSQKQRLFRCSPSNPCKIPSKIKSIIETTTSLFFGFAFWNLNNRRTRKNAGKAIMKRRNKEYPSRVCII